MNCAQWTHSPDAGWTTCSGNEPADNPQLVLVFGPREMLEDASWYGALKTLAPGADIVAASTSGEIVDTVISDDRISATLISFKKGRVRCEAMDIGASDQSFAVGKELGARLRAPDLVHIFVLSEGQIVNGSDLVRGLNTALPPGATLSGGLAGDGTRFQKTLAGLNELPRSGRIVAIGFYGNTLEVRCGSAGGWSPFGPERIITRSHGNVLDELDGVPALGTYKHYLGEKAAELPGAALRFPLSVQREGETVALVRTILSIDDTAGTMTFAGDVPVGSRVSLMRGFFNDLIDGATEAAEQVKSDSPPELVLCVSCVGRRLVMGQRSEEETESIRLLVGPSATMTGFYSYGELAPGKHGTGCQLHNQTMTLTTFKET